MQCTWHDVCTWMGCGWLDWLAARGSCTADGGPGPGLAWARVAPRYIRVDVCNRSKPTTGVRIVSLVRCWSLPTPIRCCTSTTSSRCTRCTTGRGAALPAPSRGQKGGEEERMRCSATGGQTGVAVAGSRMAVVVLWATYVRPCGPLACIPQRPALQPVFWASGHCPMLLNSSGGSGRSRWVHYCVACGLLAAASYLQSRPDHSVSCNDAARVPDVPYRMYGRAALALDLCRRCGVLATLCRAVLQPADVPEHARRGRGLGQRVPLRAHAPSHDGPAQGVGDGRRGARYAPGGGERRPTARAAAGWAGVEWRVWLGYWVVGSAVVQGTGKLTGFCPPAHRGELETCSHCCPAPSSQCGCQFT